MSFTMTFGICCLLAYILQFLFSIYQIKNFNVTYRNLRRLGRVAIGRRSGKFRSGTIVMFAIDKKGIVISAKKMQGVTVLSKFKDMPAYIGEDIHYFDRYNPIVRKENKLLQIAIENARDIFLQVEADCYQKDSDMDKNFAKNLSIYLKLLWFNFKKRTIIRKKSINH